MKFSSKLLLTILALLVLLAAAQPAQAQTAPLNAARLSIDLWPEYDRPAMLVIYNVELSPDIQLPAQVSLRIPAAGSPPFRVLYYLQNSERPYSLDVRTYPEEEWSRVVFTTPAARFRLEFYDGRMDFNSPNRTYVFTWPGDISSDTLTIRVKQPALATEFSLPSRFSEPRLDEDGLYVSSANFSQMDTGISYTFAVEYFKDSSRPSFTRQTLHAIAPITRETTGRFNFDPYLPIAILVVIVLTVAGLIMLFGAGRILDMLKLGDPRDGHASLADPARPAAPESPSVYCPICGSRASLGDNFCRVCGSPLNT